MINMNNISQQQGRYGHYAVPRSRGQKGGQGQGQGNVAVGNQALLAQLQQLLQQLLTSINKPTPAPSTAPQPTPNPTPRGNELGSPLPISDTQLQQLNQALYGGRAYIGGSVPAVQSILDTNGDGKASLGDTMVIGQFSERDGMVLSQSSPVTQDILNLLQG